MTGQTIAIIGGGPAGSSAAERLSQGGGRGAPGGTKNRVLVFEENVGWEKPCGGGLTHKVLRRYPYLAKVAGGAKLLHDAEFTSGTGAVMKFHLRTPLAIYSRSTFNKLLLDRAEDAGAEVVPERIMDLRRDGSGWQLIGREKTYHADFIVLAGGARSRLRSKLTHDLTPNDFMMTFGYYLNVPCEVLRVQFYEKFDGYAWAFPRPDHVSVGIGGKMSEGTMPEMKARLHDFMERSGYAPDPDRVYAHVLPSLSTESWRKLELSGPGWALVGDAGGLVDPVTGEGIYYAMRSGEILAEAILDGQPQTYPKRVAKEFGRALAQGARIGKLFYHGEFLGAGVTTRMIEFGASNPKLLEILQDLIEGVQPYGGLFNRLQRVLGRAIVEKTAGKIYNALSFSSPSGEKDAV